MSRLWVAVGAMALSLSSLAAHAQNYSTGAVNEYGVCGVSQAGGASELSNRVEGARRFRVWYDLAGFPNVSQYVNQDVWPTDFKDGPGNDMGVPGGSDVPNIYLFAGHGICYDRPTATDSDGLATCSTPSKPVPSNPHARVFTDVYYGASSRWGNSGGRLQFAFMDASCSMDLISIGHNWFPPFQGLHIAVGLSGTKSHDAYDSYERPSEFGARTVGFMVIFGSFEIPLFPREPVTWAWMDTGLIDVNDQVCAVAIANAVTRDAVIARRDNEHVKPAWDRPSGNWYGWRWTCE